MYLYQSFLKMFTSIFMRVLVFVLKSIIVRILSSKEVNSGENPAYGIGISCKYMHVHLYIVPLLHIKYHEIMLYNRSSADKLHITVINITAHSPIKFSYMKSKFQVNSYTDCEYTTYTVL